MNNYLSTVYSEETRPKTEYPQQLAEHLFKWFDMKEGMKLLEIGCGRGDFLKGFKNIGLDVYGMDISKEAIDMNPGIDVEIVNIEKNFSKHPNNMFDVIYSKSLLEHLYDPENYMREAHRMLKRGGLFLTLVPDWEANYKTYFDDYTHRTPYTKVSLNDLYKMSGFKDVSVVKFRQLPIVWEHPWLNYFCAAISPFVPVRTNIKFLFWSRELMLVGSGRK